MKSAAGFGTFVREKKVRVADKHLCSECSKAFNSAFNLKRHMVSKLHKKKPSHENQVKKVKSAAGFGILVREKSVRVSDKYL